MALFRKPKPADEPDDSPAASGEPTPGGPADPGGEAPGRLAEDLAELVEGMERAPLGVAPEEAAAPGRELTTAGGPADETAMARSWERGRGRAGRLVVGVARQLGRGGRLAVKGAGVGGRALTERLLVAAPRIPVRNLRTLRGQHPDMSDPERLADLLTVGACRASGALGAGVGAAAMLPVPPAMAVEIAAETLAVAAVEVKLIAELHEVYGVPAPGNTSQRAGAYVAAWANRRGIDATLLVKPAGLAAMAVGSEVRQRLRKRLTRSSLRRLPSLVPLMIGAGIGAQINRRDTAKLAKQVRADLRGRKPLDPGYWTAAAPGPAAGGTGGRDRRR
ncbi:hypothetical protein [Kitasatospora sp. NPDC057015]|uniref:hypothetical protein n=1 Tax=Kitasatospora sp. NPDC057015 TaxID=3346001 RepID=UPI003629429D